MNIAELLEKPMFFLNLSAGKTKPISMGGYTISVGKKNDSDYFAIRVEKVEENVEKILWIYLDPKNNENDKNDMEMDVENLISLFPEEYWISVTYSASFRRSGDLYAAEYSGFDSWAEAYENIREQDKDKAWRDDSNVSKNDNAPSWWYA